MKKILVLAAENSAENYGAQVIDEFSKQKADVRFFGLGGEPFLKRRVDLWVHNRELAIVGLLEVVSHIPRLKKIMNLLCRKAREEKVDAALLIDYPDFNLRLAKKLKKLGIPVYYYISPTVWAWRYYRVNQIRKFVHHLFIIFPFEIDIYEREKIPFTYTGHPLIPVIKATETRADFRQRLGVAGDDFLLTLLPGSRPSEIRSLLPEMLQTVAALAKEKPLTVFLLRAVGIPGAMISHYLDHSPVPVHVLDQAEGYDLIQASDFVIATCGTSNLEIAVLGVPFVSVYRVNRLSYILGKRFVHIKNYSIVNILAGEQIVPELIQGQFTAVNILTEMRRILDHPGIKEKMLSRFQDIRRLLGSEKKPAEIIYQKIAGELFYPKSGEELIR